MTVLKEEYRTGSVFDNGVLCVRDVRNNGIGQGSGHLGICRCSKSIKLRDSCEGRDRSRRVINFDILERIKNHLWLTTGNKIASDPWVTAIVVDTH